MGVVQHNPQCAIIISSVAVELNLLEFSSSSSSSDAAASTPMDSDLDGLRSLISAIYKENQIAAAVPAPAAAAARRCPSKSRKRTVNWGTVEVFSHELILGDNPSTSAGPPVTINWKSDYSHKFSVSNYEKYRPDPRTKHEMLMTKCYREDLLRDIGYSRGEIKQASHEAQRIRISRLRSSRDGFFCLRNLCPWARSKDLCRMGQDFDNKPQPTQDMTNLSSDSKYS